MRHFSESCLQTNKNTNTWITINYTDEKKIHVKKLKKKFLINSGLITVVLKAKKKKPL